MSRTEPEYFRLSYEESTGMYRDQADDSLWQKHDLFDFGWGREPGFCRLPIRCKADLIELLFTASVEDDYFGAAAILLEENAEEALPLFERAITDKERYPQATDRLKVVGLNRAVNRSEIVEKSADEIQADFDRWHALSEIICRK